MKWRLPFALGLAIASMTMAVINLWPFTPPDAASRIRAAAVDEAPEVLRPMLADRLYPPLEKPRPGDWLASGHEWAQSVKAYRNSKPNFPDATRKVLYLLPLGEFPEKSRAPSLEALREYLGLFFGMESRLAPAETEAATGATRRINGESGQPQMLTSDILKWLPGKLPADAYAMLAVTMTDLYPKESWNFVFGEATFKERVGVFSLARNSPGFLAGETGGQLEPHPTVRALILRRACTTLSHETGHMFGMTHCRYYQCLMGGSGSVEEADRSPVSVCPVCLHKLFLAKAFDPAARQRGLLDFYLKHDMKEEAKQAQVLWEAATATPGAGQGTPP